VSAEREDRSAKAFEDLDPTETEAGSVKGGRFPIEGQDASSSGFSMGSVKWTMRRRKKKKASGSTGGGRPV
jgi:hypothetical protein